MSSPSPTSNTPLSPAAVKRLQSLEHKARVEGFVQFEYGRPLYLREPESATIRYAGSDAIRVRADAHACPPFWAEAQIFASDWAKARSSGFMHPTLVRCIGGRLSGGPSKLRAVLTSEGRVIFSEAKPEDKDVVYYAAVTLPDACTTHLARAASATPAPIAEDDAASAAASPSHA